MTREIGLPTRQICIDITDEQRAILRGYAVKMGFKASGRGNISALVRFIADRIQVGDEPFKGLTLYDSILTQFLDVAESLQVDFSLEERDVRGVLQAIASRRFPDVPWPEILKAILETCAIIYGERKAP